jgi:hypothetical protein
MTWPSSRRRATSRRSKSAARKSKRWSASKALQAQGFNVEPDDINLPGKLDRIEKYTVRIRFAEDLETDVKVWVAPDAESKAAIEAAQKTRATETATTEQ